MTVKIYQGARTTAAYTFENVLCSEFVNDGKWMKIVFENMDITYIPTDYIRQIECKNTTNEVANVAGDITASMSHHEKTEVEEFEEKLNNALNIDYKLE